jgi:hypothetical protein
MPGFFSVLRRFRVFSGGTVLRASSRVAVKLLGAIGPLEFMTLARNGEQGHGHKKDGETFHLAAS